MQGPNLGKGGIDTTPSEERAPPIAPAQLAGTDTADIGMGSLVPLSAEAVGIITRLHDMKVGVGSRYFIESHDKFCTYTVLNSP
jgi:hypothetical protein